MSLRDDYLRSISNAIEYMEAHLDRQLTAEEVAAEAGFSPYHFHRVFAGVLGESVSEYIKKRRLSQAARLVRNSERPLIELAFEFGFESQEAFTRAFKRMYGITPGKYRRLRDALSFPDKSKATLELIEHLEGGITMQPKIVTRDAEKAIGMGGPFPHAAFQAISALWDKFMTRMDEVPNVAGKHALGVCMPSHPKFKLGKDDGFVYLAALPVTSFETIPEGMVECELKAGRYAVFTHRGPLSNLPLTLNYIWGTWMPKGECERREAPDFELYDERFNPNSDDSEFDIYIPIA